MKVNSTYYIDLKQHDRKGIQIATTCLFLESPTRILLTGAWKHPDDQDNKKVARDYCLLRLQDDYCYLDYKDFLEIWEQYEYPPYEGREYPIDWYTWRNKADYTFFSPFAFKRIFNTYFGFFEWKRFYLHTLEKDLAKSRLYDIQKYCDGELIYFPY